MMRLGNEADRLELPSGLEKIEDGLIQEIPTHMHSGW